MALQKLFADMELDDGTTHHVRVLVADKVAYEKTSRVQQWTEETHPVTSNLFLGWAAAKRLGIVTCGFDEFKATRCVDFLLSNDDEPAEDEDGNPTSSPTES